MTAIMLAQRPAVPTAGVSHISSPIEDLIGLDRTPGAAAAAPPIAGGRLTYFSDFAAAKSPAYAARWINGRADAAALNFDRLAELKIATSNVAMHLEEGWRRGIFKQLDRLLDVEEWDFSDELPDVNAYRTFLRMVVFLGRPRRPSLGANADGQILAGWMSGEDRLTVVCLPNDQVRWVLSEQRDDGRESAAGRTTVRRLPEVLKPYDPAKWFAIADHVHP